jgi:hypothetical protein
MQKSYFVTCRQSKVTAEESHISNSSPENPSINRQTALRAAHLEGAGAG